MDMLQPNRKTTPQRIFGYAIKQHERLLEERKELMAKKVRGCAEVL